MIHRRWLLVLAVLALPSPASLLAREGALEVVCSSPALASIARRIGGERAAVSCAVPPGKDASTWRPDAKAARAMQKADLVVLNGAGLESWIDHVSLPATRRVVTTKGLGSALLTLDEVITHSHGSEGEHSHQGENPHTWLDPRIAAKQARTLLDAMVRRDPPGEKTYTAGYESLAADLGKLDGELDFHCGACATPPPIEQPADPPSSGHPALPAPPPPSSQDSSIFVERLTLSLDRKQLACQVRRLPCTAPDAGERVSWPSGRCRRS